MILALMQPYFFPYLGYFDLIRSVDLWVVFDEVQYIRRGWMHRNRILHPRQGWQYVSVPIAKHARATRIDQIQIAEAEAWKDRLTRQLAHYRGHAPHYESTVAMVKDCCQQDEPYLSRLNTTILDRICRYLGLEFRYAYLSDLALSLGPIQQPGDWALRVCQSLGADTYLNPPGGRSLYDAKRFADHGITLRFQSPLEFEYACHPYAFVPGLSIIDVCMWNSPQSLRARWQLGRRAPLPNRPAGEHFGESQKDADGTRNATSVVPPASFPASLEVSDRSSSL